MRFEPLVASVRARLVRSSRSVSFLPLHRRYRDFTMASSGLFRRNLRIVDSYRHVQGCVVECGVWRGGMSAGMAAVLGPERDYFLFDSFEGLPPATSLDGEEAKRWQENVGGDAHYDNCHAPIDFARRAMEMSGVPRYTLVKGWFEKTLPSFVPPAPIAILRLDGDWYESTLVAMESLFRHLASDGVVIIDDYYTWDGCSRAVHDFLSRHQSTARITQQHGICVLVQR